MPDQKYIIVMKKKRLNDNEYLCLYRNKEQERVVFLVYVNGKDIKKAKSYVLGTLSSANSMIEGMARAEYKKWLKHYWVYKELSVDDWDFI